MQLSAIMKIYSCNRTNIHWFNVDETKTYTTNYCIFDHERGQNKIYLKPVLKIKFMTDHHLISHAETIQSLKLFLNEQLNTFLLFNSYGNLQLRISL